jgi:hypothetical protein
MKMLDLSLRNRAVVDRHRHELLGNTAVESIIQTPGSATVVADKLAPTAKILFVTSEMGDFVKAGGLGEVSAALPRALRALSDVRVLIPAYRDLRSRRPVIEVIASMPATAELPPWSLGRLKARDGLVVYVVLCDELYDRPGSPYVDERGEAWPDNDIRFGRLSLAAAEIAGGLVDPDWCPDLVHVNDWTSALAPGYMRWRGIDTPTILTVHNLAYQGQFPASRLGALGIPGDAFNVDGVEFYGQMSFLKAGLVFASHITTVSETYAREITTPEHGCGLDGLLRERLAQGRLTASSTVSTIAGCRRRWRARTCRSLGRMRARGRCAGPSGCRPRVVRSSPSSRGSCIRRASTSRSRRPSGSCRRAVNLS